MGTGEDSLAALWQDEGAMLDVQPKNSDHARREVLVEFDEHIGEYRKMRRQLAGGTNPAQ